MMFSFSLDCPLEFKRVVVDSINAECARSEAITAARLEFGSNVRVGEKATIVTWFDKSAMVDSTNCYSTNPDGSTKPWAWFSRVA